MDDLSWIRKGLEKPGKSQTGLARALGRAPSAVTNLLKGTRELKAREIATIAEYLDTVPPDQPTGFSEETSVYADGARTVPVVGYVGAGAEAHYYAVSQGDLDRVPAPESATRRTVAVEIRGDSLGTFFDRWLVFYDNVRRPATPDLVGQLCVVGLEDERVLIKKIRAGKAGKYNLVSNADTEVIRNVAIEWAAKVKHMEPK